MDRARTRADSGGRTRPVTKTGVLPRSGAPLPAPAGCSPMGSPLFRRSQSSKLATAVAVVVDRSSPRYRLDDPLGLEGGVAKPLDLVNGEPEFRGSFKACGSVFDHLKFLMRQRADEIQPRRLARCRRERLAGARRPFVYQRNWHRALITPPSRVLDTRRRAAPSWRRRSRRNFDAKRAG